jgi:uncharacterized membrane protein YgcG
MSERTMQGRRGLLVCSVLALLVCLPALGATVDAIPRPTPGTWSVDTTGTLRPETLAEVNRLGTEVDASGLGQLALVVVDSTEGVQPRAFATDLFNRWGIGHEDRDDGVLLFVALSDRKAEIVLGDGVDTADDIQRSDALMARIVPFFASGDPDGAVLEGTRGLSTLLAQSALNGGAPLTDSEREDARRGDSPSFLGRLFAFISNYFFWLVLGLIGLLMFLFGDKSESGGPWWPGGYSGGGYTGGGSSSSSSGGGSFGGGSSSGSGSSGSW